MTLDTKTAEVAERLEELAVMLGKDFLREIGSRERVMSLHGAEPEVLNFVRRKLGEYFAKKGEHIAVRLNRNGGYPVNVGYFTSNTPVR